MASRLGLYQRAAQILGERRPLALDERVAIRRRFDVVWDAEGVKHCLQRGLWNHSMRAARLDYSPSVEPEFGYRYSFDKPTDWVRTAIVATDESFRSPARYADEVGFWWADWTILYVKFVSDDVQYGMDLSLWPANFTEFVAHSFALKAAKATTGSNVDVDTLKRDEKRMLILARSTDAMDEPTQFVRSGWAEARMSRRNLENG